MATRQDDETHRVFLRLLPPRSNKRLPQTSRKEKIMHDNQERPAMSEAEKRWRNRMRFDKRLGTIKRVWHNYVINTERFLVNPSLYCLLGVAAFACACSFIWVACLQSAGEFWGNFNSILFSGWITGLMSLCALWQVRAVRAAGGLALVAAFASAAIYLFYHLAQADATSRLLQLFPMSAGELSNAKDIGTMFIFAALIGTAFPAGTAVWYVLFIAYSVSASPQQRSSSWIFLGASVGLVLAYALLGAGSARLINSDAIDVLIARSAKELDFSTNHLCDGVPQGEYVHYMTTTADFGLAAPFGDFPERPLHSVKKTDEDMLGVIPSRSAFHRVSCNASDLAQRTYEMKN
jgi:hypothetical protein